MADVDYSSRARLAASIEQLLREVIPRPTKGDDLTASIDRALQDESCRNERSVAYLRLGATVALAMLFVIEGGIASLDIVSARSVAVVFWLAASVGVTVALRTGWYRPWLRRALPLGDALMIIVAGTAMTPNPASIDQGMPGLAALSGLGVLLTISGALRLTRTGVYYATILAVIAITGVCVRINAPAGVLAISMVPVVLAGMLALAVTQLARRLITTQVGQSAMHRLYGEAREVIDAREEVLRIVAHDLRNPLSTVAMTTQLLLDVPASDEQRTERLTVIQRAGERMRRLINDLLDVSIIEAGRLAIEPRPVSVAAILADAMEMLRPIAVSKPVFLELSADDDLPKVQADPARTLQVLSNLVGNAIKFTPKGGRITISATREGAKVRFEVADTGPGIAPEQLTNIFGRFWKANRADTRGIGLGLSIAKGIVEAHGEELRVTSTVGVGSAFSFPLEAVE